LYFICSQLWLNCLVDEHHFTNIYKALLHFFPCLYFGPSPAVGNPISWMAWQTKKLKKHQFYYSKKEKFTNVKFSHIPKNETYKYNRIWLNFRASLRWKEANMLKLIIIIIIIIRKSCALQRWRLFRETFLNFGPLPYLWPMGLREISNL